MSDTDLELLARYTRQHAEDAFAELVGRHLGLVHSAALRQVRSPQLAEEVAQSTFIKLARHARQLAPGTILTAWLYQVARRESIDVVRREASRQLREQIATEMNAMNATAADWTHIEPLLDEAMHALDDTDRAAVLLRYFENKSLREVGATLGTSENAAQKRLGRAVERLREFFSKRGVTVGVSGLVVVIAANAVQAAPAGLAAALTSASLAGATAGTGTTLPLLKLMAMSKLKTTLAVAIALLILSGGGVALWLWPESTRTVTATPIDLSNAFNGSLTENWVGSQLKGNSLASLPTGPQTFGGVRFDIGTGLIQLASSEFIRRRFRSFPPNVADIPVQQKFKRIHLLHGASYEAPSGTSIGTVTLHYEDGKTHMFTFEYDVHVTDWWLHTRGPPESLPRPTSPDSVLAWTGRNPVVGSDVLLRLYRTTFYNPQPGIPVKSVEYSSLMTSSAPFLVALSVD